MRFYLQSLARELLPDERVAKCLRAIVPGQKTVQVVYHPGQNRARYKNLLTCARLWQCAVCATRITELRAAELLEAVTRWNAGEGFNALASFTMQHHMGHTLKSTVTGMRDARRKLMSGAPWQRFAKKYGWFGSVTSLEVTYGENGWHPHLHELPFLRPMTADEWLEFQHELKIRWLAAVNKVGREASYERGLDIRDAETDVYEYVAKFGKLPSDKRWTLEREVAKAPTKRAHRDGKTPFQLLLDYGDGDEQAGRLFQEYADVFKGRHQLDWSNGLRAALGMTKAVTDDAAAADVPSDYILLAELDKIQWRTVLHLPTDIRGQILAVAAKGDRAALELLLHAHGVTLHPLPKVAVVVTQFDDKFLGNLFGDMRGLKNV